MSPLFSSLSLSRLTAAVIMFLTLPLGAAEPAKSGDEAKIRTERYQQLIHAAFTAKSAEESAAQLENGGRTLLKEYPDQRDLGGSLLTMAADRMPEPKGRVLLKEVVDGNFAEGTKENARGILRRLDAKGQPLDLHFTALDGRAVDLRTMRGKVVLIDFWATWCGPCVAEIPHVLAAYEKFHDRGFEVIGISFDSDKAKLEKFIADRKTPWPQYFDGKGWENEYGRYFGIRGIPVMWLVDKKGVLRMNTRQNVAENVEQLLGEL